MCLFVCSFFLPISHQLRELQRWLRELEQWWLNEFSFFQCFDAVAWFIGMAYRPWKSSPAIPERSFFGNPARTRVIHQKEGQFNKNWENGAVIIGVGELDQRAHLCLCDLTLMIDIMVTRMASDMQITWTRYPQYFCFRGPMQTRRYSREEECWWNEKPVYVSAVLH